MPKKLVLTVVVAMALVALDAANTYTTTMITTTVDEEANPGRQQKYCQQIHGRQFKHCQRYLSQSRGFSGRGDDEVAEMVSENPGRQQEQEHLRQCCQELRNVQDQCQCEAISGTQQGKLSMNWDRDMAMEAGKVDRNVKKDMAGKASGNVDKNTAQEANPSRYIRGLNNF